MLRLGQVPVHHVDMDALRPARSVSVLAPAENPAGDSTKRARRRSARHVDVMDGTCPTSMVLLRPGSAARTKLPLEFT